MPDKKPHIKVSNKEAILEFFSRRGFVSNDGESVFMDDKPRRMKIHIAASNIRYPIITIHIKGQTRMVLVHRLQAYQKFGDRIWEKGLVVRHINGISTDNSWGNLALGTQRENVLDKPRESFVKFGKEVGCRHIVPKERTPIEIENAIINDVAGGETRRSVASKYGIGYNTVCDIVKFGQNRFEYKKKLNKIFAQKRTDAIHAEHARKRALLMGNSTPAETLTPSE